MALVCALAVADASADQVYVDSLFAVQVTDAIVYGTAPISNPPGDLELLLDLYEPLGPAPVDRPGVVLIHGGGFTGGSRLRPHLVRIASAMAGRGYTAVSIDYRLDGQLAGQGGEISPEFQQLFQALGGASYPYADAIAAAVEDATRAHRWLVAHAESLQVDPSRLTLGGDSAGAITSLFMAYVIDDYGVANVPDVGAVMDLWGGLYGFHPHMEAGEPPLFIVHGQLDNVVPYSNALQLRQQAVAVGVPYEFHGIPGAGHGFDEIPIFTLEDPPGQTIFNQLVLFFYEHVCPTADVADQSQPTATYKLYPNHPNPFNPTTTIRYDLARAQEVGVRVLDPTGRVVRILQPARWVAAGHHRIQWDGRGHDGEVLSSGVYYCYLQADGRTETHAMVLMK